MHDISVCVISYNGIDRLDNSKGYEKENTVTCCGICNKMKLTLTLKEFIEQCSQIYRHHRRTEYLAQSALISTTKA